MRSLRCAIASKRLAIVAVVSLTALVVTVAFARAVRRQEPGRQSRLTRFLRDDLGFDAAAVSRAMAGDVVTLTPDSDNSREVVVAAAAIIEAPRAFLVDRLADVEWMRRDDHTLGVSRFSEMPTAGDLRALVLPPEEIESLRACRVGNCDFQMSASAIEQLRREVHWDRPYWGGQAMAIYRRMLAEYAEAYWRGGNTALIEYHDERVPTRLRDDLTDILGRWPFMATRFPALHRHLRDFPRSTDRSLDDTLYWSLDVVSGLKPMVTLTHLSIHYPPDPALFDTVFAAKQIYASHYVDASMGLTMLAERETRPASVLLVYLNRSRSGFLSRRVFGGLARSFVNRRLRATTADYLRRTKTRIEEAYSEGDDAGGG